jgi:uncharacterized membrane protein YsdA (DUF1294 family)/cold shock CspA family protein
MGGPIAAQTKFRIIMHTSKIVEWDRHKGFGYLRHQKSRLFLHRRDFSEHHKRPAKGDRIRYRIGSDSKGRLCAVDALHVNDGGKITVFTLLLLVILVTMPVFAWSHYLLVKKPELSLLLPLPLIINIITYFVFKRDKALARAKAWRTSEAMLHFLELIGGWPAALLAQKQYRHKCSKTDYKTTYWLIVILNLYLAIDYLLNWKIFGIVVGAVSA